MNKLQKTLWLIILLFVAACNNNSNTSSSNAEKNEDSSASFAKGSYGYDAAFMKKNTKHVLELQNDDGAKVLLSADYQGRVMTSTAGGDSSNSFGWLNYDLIASQKAKLQFNPVGGEERFWMGPEGGQYSIYFKQGDSFNIAHWQVPFIIDTVMYDIMQVGKTSATFTKSATLTNYSATAFNVGITRKITLLGKNEVEQKLHASLPNNIKYVAYETDNQVKNTGSNEWKKETGLLSIWLLGMMTPTPETKVMIPFHAQKNARTFITDDYFGKIAADRLLVKDSVLYFRCDGKARGKLGISPMIAKPIVASYDFQKNVLSILIPEVHKGEPYVNSKWEMQKQPYKGDVINSYNDGPLQDGSQLGPFYEIESSSPVKELKPGETQQYRQTTCHLQGDYTTLKSFAQQLLGVDLDEVKKW